MASLLSISALTLHECSFRRQHNGWQKQQIEKRRREQLKQRKIAAKKKPVGDGIKVDTAIPNVFTKCGLKLLKLEKPSAGMVIHKREKNVVSMSSSRKIASQNITRGAPLHKGKYAPPSPLPSKDINHVLTPKNAMQNNVHLLDDGTIVSDKMPTDQIDLRDSYTSVSKNPGPNIHVHERLREMSLNNNANINAKKNSSHAGISKRRINNKYRADEGKENGECTHNREESRTRRRNGPNKTSGTRNPFTASTDIDALKREHADAIDMLKEMDRLEGHRRQYRDLDRSYSDSYDSVVTSDDELVQTHFTSSKSSESSSIPPNSHRLNNQQCDDNSSFFNSDDNDCTNSSTSTYIDVLKEEDVSQHCSDDPSGIDNNETFTWMPDGLKNATHLSISIRDIEGANVDEETKESHDGTTFASNESSGNDNSTESNGYADYSSDEDGYSSGTFE